MAFAFLLGGFLFGLFLIFVTAVGVHICDNLMDRLEMAKVSASSPRPPQDRHYPFV